MNLFSIFGKSSSDANLIAEKLHLLKFFTDIKNRGLDEATYLLELDRLVLEIMECERFTLFVYDDVINKLVSRIAHGVDHRLEIDMGVGIVGRAFEEKRIIVENNPYESKDFNHDIDNITAFHTQNMIVIPLFQECGKREGALQILNKKSGEFVDEDVVKLQVIADFVTATYCNLT